MRFQRILCLLGGVFALFSVHSGNAEEANATLYIVDQSPEHAEMGGACIPYTPLEKPGENRELLAFAKGPAGSTIVMLALQGDAVYGGLEPVITKMTEDSKAARFPNPESEKKWAFTEKTPKVDLYVLAFTEGDPQLEKIGEYLEWLKDSLKEGDDETAMLHTHAIKNRLSNIMRQQSTDSYLETYGDSLLANTDTIVGEGKAAVTRGATKNLLQNEDTKPSAAVAAVRRGLKSIDAEWKEDSRAIKFGLNSPGLLVFPITTTP
ncbi:MAG: hypothetical protein CMO55_03830 [Verrucomicrobiales bacterium]|nr:hypothetical protein [Verrucomicrobiales bacterium]